ncbi:biotin transport system substrate-specific component [Propionibacterium cyclohexanicum]|uniref:Biotin transporter n=1 Tax=Propionibacterium cyclohexanicum TaxID=64702 RepID=A0A1H9QUG0_9ACTN|nr:biotin transporter BioY [Propionibacterium cyclohexanicum]SER64094.1 biotin transport system substrate-specific component [Propionibacterium cyclohexanicum]
MSTQAHEADRSAAGSAPRAGLGGSDIALIAVFAALMAVFSIVPAIFQVGGIPFAIQMIVVLLAPLVLGPVRGASSCALYILVGVAGLPVFSNGASGPAVLIGPTGGYLFGFIASGFVAGAAARAALRARPSRRMLPVVLIAAAVLGALTVHLCGVIFFMAVLHMDLTKALLTTAPFFPWDVVKAVIAGLLAVAVFTAFPALRPTRKA